MSILVVHSEARIYIINNHNHMKECFLQPFFVRQYLFIQSLGDNMNKMGNLQVICDTILIISMFVINFLKLIANSYETWPHSLVATVFCVKAGFLLQSNGSEKKRRVFSIFQDQLRKGRCTQSSGKMTADRSANRERADKNYFESSGILFSPQSHDSGSK